MRINQRNAENFTGCCRILSLILLNFINFKYQLEVLVDVVCTAHMVRACLNCIYLLQVCAQCLSRSSQTHIGLHSLISVGKGKWPWNHIVKMTGGGFLHARVCWLRWDFIWRRKLLAVPLGFPGVALSGHLAVPRRIFTPMLLLWLTWSEA